MIGIALVIALAFGLIDPSFVAEAQTPTKLSRVGWLGNMAPPPPPVGQLEGFRQGLREAGYVEGQNVSGQRGISIASLPWHSNLLASR